MIKNIKPYQPKKTRSWTKHIKGFFYAICIALMIRLVVLEPYKIPSESMYPSILKGDMLMANKFIYGVFLPVVDLKIPGFVKPNHGDIILFQAPNYNSPGKMLEIINFFTFGLFNLDNNMDNPRFFIKRVIGEPGDKISLVDPRKNNFKFQTIRNGEEQILGSYSLSSSLPELNDPSVSFYTEKNTPAVIQYQKNNENFFFEQPHDIIDDLYVPAKGDHLKFILMTYDFNKDMVAKAKENQSILDVSYSDRIKVITTRTIAGKEQQVYESTISGRLFNIFYYSQRPNSLLEPKDIYDLYLNTSVVKEVKDNYYFVMGDNRDDSQDSRYWGFVPHKYVIGSPMIRYWPLSRMGGVNLKPTSH